LRYKKKEELSKENNILLDKLEDFIRKYYQNQLLRGAILGVSLASVAFFVLSFAEFFGRFGVATRTTLFFVFVVICLAVLGWFVVRPLLGLFNLNRNFGIQEASIAVGNHFPEVKDKLLNTLQLQQSAGSESSGLLLASIEQKTAELKPVPFVRAIPFKKNLTYVKYALLPALALLLILLVSPGFKKSSTRVISYNKHFEIQAPFSFETSLGDNQYIQNQDIEVDLSLAGDKLPLDAYINIGEQRFKMKNDANGAFTFTIRNVQKSIDVYFDAGGFISPLYPVEIARKPSLLGYKARVTYPAYLQLPTEELRNLSELNIPAGSTVDWQFNTKNVDELRINPSDTVLKNEGNLAHFKKRFLTSELLTVSTKNNEVDKGDSVFFQVNVIPDEYPQIQVESKNDSLSNKILYFLGNVQDDHGFSKLAFNYRYVKTADASKKGKRGSTAIAIKRDVNNQKFYHYWNLGSLNIAPEEEISYYFTVWDNDGVRGAKASSTAERTYKAPSLEELKQETEKANKEIKTSMSDAQSGASEMQEEISEIEKMLTEKKNLDWNDKKKIEDLLEKGKKLQEEVKKTIDKNLEKNFKEEEFKQMDEELQEKQKQLEELMEDVLDEETKKLMEEIQKLLEENKTEQLQQKLDQFKFSQKELNKEMDRMLELFKELELEKKLNETIDKLNELAKEQKELSEKAKDKKEDAEALAKKQEELKKEFDDVKKDLEDIEKKDQELETPLGLSDKKEQQKSIDQKMQSGANKMQNGKQKDASEDMEDAAEELQELAEQMQQEMQSAQEEQQMEDYNNLRQILENLVQLSFNQEEVIDGFKENRNYSPKYVELRQKQRKIKDDTRLVEDSLLALSKRNLQIKSFVNTEIARVNDNIDKSLYYLGERYTSNALVHQQYAMTGYNNLALMLSESLKQMQQQMKMKSQSKGKKNKGKPQGQCQNPGQQNPKDSGKPNMSAIKKMQQQLAEQLKQMQEGQKKGEKPGSKEFAEMAAKQAAIRKQLRDLDRQLQKEGKGGQLGDLKKTQDIMDEIEEDMYFKSCEDTSNYRLYIVVASFSLYFVNNTLAKAAWSFLKNSIASPFTMVGWMSLRCLSLQLASSTSTGVNANPFSVKR
jgi:hypothetical protein